MRLVIGYQGRREAGVNDQVSFGLKTFSGLKPARISSRLYSLKFFIP